MTWGAKGSKSCLPSAHYFPCLHLSSVYTCLPPPLLPLSRSFPRRHDGRHNGTALLTLLLKEYTAVSSLQDVIVSHGGRPSAASTRIMTLFGPITAECGDKSYVRWHLLLHSHTFSPITTRTKAQQTRAPHISRPKPYSSSSITLLNEQVRPPPCSLGGSR